MFSWSNVQAAPISGVRAPVIFLRFGDTVSAIEDWSDELSLLEAPSIWRSGRFAPFFFLLLPETLPTWPSLSSRGVEVTFARGKLKFSSLGEFTGVHPEFEHESGEPGYLSLRSLSVPYPLSTSIALNDLGSKGFGGQPGNAGKAHGVRGLTGIDDSLDCARMAVAPSVHRYMMSLSIDNCIKPELPGS